MAVMWLLVGAYAPEMNSPSLYILFFHGFDVVVAALSCWLARNGLGKKKTIFCFLLIIHVDIYLFLKIVDFV